MYVFLLMTLTCNEYMYKGCNVGVFVNDFNLKRVQGLQCRCFR